MKPSDLRASQPRTDHDIPVSHVTPRPLDLITIFTSAGDDVSDADPANWVKWTGDRLTFNMSAGDATKHVDLKFSTEVHIKDGYILTRDAPFGATVCIDIMDPTGSVLIESFGKYVPIMGSGWFTMNSDDKGRVPQGFIVRVTVKNSRGAAYGEDEPSAFCTSGRIEMYRGRHTPL